MPTPSTSSPSSTANSSGIQTIDALLSGEKWGSSLGQGVSLNYSFPWSNGSAVFTGYLGASYSSSNEPTASSHYGLNAVERAATGTALQAWSKVANLNFSEVADTVSSVGDLRFTFSSAVSGSIWGWAYGPSLSPIGGDVWVNPTIENDSWTVGSYNYEALIHEIGHALGLKHPFDGAPTLPSGQDSTLYTIMSYTAPANNMYATATGYSWSSYGVNINTPMVFDIAAIQYLYGANTSYHASNDTYTFDSTKPFFESIWDAGGVDTLSASNFSTDCTLDLTPGHYSSLHYARPTNVPSTVVTYDGTNNLGIAYNCIIENAVGGSGNDTLIGNSASNLLDGGSGNDTVRLTGSFSQYRIAYTSATAQFTFTDLTNGRDGVDTIRNVESFVFSDVTKTFAQLSTSVTAPNTAPTLSGLPTTTATTTVGVAAALVDFTVADAEGDTLQLSLVAANGTINGLVDADSTRAGIQLSGSAAQINQAVAGATFTPSAAGASSISLSLSDGKGGTAAGTYSLYANTGTGVTPLPPTTLPPLTKQSDFVVLQYASSAVVGADEGNDTYLLSGSMLPAGQSITISDTKGSNSLQLANGLSIASSLVASNTLQLTLSNGSVVTVLGADAFTYDVTGNSTAGLDNTDVSYSSFVQTTLGTTVPTASGVATGRGSVIGNAAAATPFTVSAKTDNFLVLQYASSAVIGSDEGNDTYLLSNSMLTAGQNLTISDTKGSNSLQLASGLSIASSLVASNTLQLTLSNGSIVTVLGADAFTYDVGGNLTAGLDNPDVSYSNFVQGTLGTAVPTTGIATGGAATIGAGATTLLTVGSSGSANATSATETFSFAPASAKAITANTQLTLNQFDVTKDKLQFDLTTALGLTTLSALNGVEGIAVQINAITGSTLVNFGMDANGDVITLTLTGTTSPSSIVVNVI